MGAHKIRQQMKRERENARLRFHKSRQRNCLAVPGIHEMIIVLDHLKPSFNIGKIFRSAEAFGAKELHLVGIDFFDPAPSRGTFKAVPARFHDTFDTCYTELANRGYDLVVLEPGRGEPLPGCTLSKHSAFILGNEEFGISFDPSGYERIRSISIPQFGRVQSLNVSVAASIVMYEYIRQHSEPPVSSAGKMPVQDRV